MEGPKPTKVEVTAFIVIGRLIQLLSILTGSANIAQFSVILAYDERISVASFIVGGINIWSIFYIERMITDAKSKLKK